MEMEAPFDGLLKDAITKNFVANEQHSFTFVFTFSVIVNDLQTDCILSFLFPAETDVLVPVFSLWQVTSFQMIAGSSFNFFLFIWNMLCLCAAQLKFWFQTDLGRENSASYYRRREDSCFWLCSPWSRVGQALRPIIMLWLVKIWQVSSGGKFMQHLESCLLSQLKLTEFSVNLWCF